MSSFSRITGTGSYLPPRRLSNADMVARLAQDGIETSDGWIVERSGISARHFAEEGVVCSDLALHACRAALQAAGRSAQDGVSLYGLYFARQARCYRWGGLGCTGGL
jgi:3-oxoacyl-[acyl-carrier-protein] synthase-3